MIERSIAVDRIENIISVFGSFDQNVRLIESELGVTVTDRESELRISGEAENVMQAEKAVNGLLSLAAKGESIDSQNVRYILKLVQEGKEAQIDTLAEDVVCVTSKGKPVKAKTLGQKTYCEAIKRTRSPSASARPVRARPIWRWLLPWRHSAPRRSTALS